MAWTPDMKQFVADHLQDDTARLLFSAHRYPTLDMPFAVEQIEARRRLRNKLPEWYANPDLIMGGRIPAEQCSSEATARYKRLLVGDSRSLCDMTGGMGVDFWYMSRGLDYAIYTECQPHLCEAARHNFDVLSSAVAPSTRIEVREGLSTELPIPDVDVIYLDPARRSEAGGRIYEIEDCVPNVIAWQHDLLSHCRKLIVKVSPMADLRRTIQRLIGVSELHIVSVKNECKELLIVQHAAGIEASSVKVHCVDFLSTGMIDFCFDMTELSGSLSVPLVEDMAAMKYLYEPDVSIMKAQAFSPLSQRYPIRMLDANTHLFGSACKLHDFPGRSFVIDQVIDFSSRQLKQLKKLIPQANLSVRNFPLSPEQLRVKTGIRDGGSLFLFGCTVNNDGPKLLLCRKLECEVIS